MVRAGAAAPTHQSAMCRISRRLSMADNKTRGRTTDRKRLNMSEPYEVAYAKSDRASPERKAMFAKGTAKRAAKTGAKKKTSGSSAGRATKPSAGGKATKSSTRGSKSVAGARKSTAAKARKASASGARKASSARASGSASPAMKRTNAAPTKPRTPTKRDTPHPPTAEKTVENTAPKTMREPDAVDLLTDDHLAVTALFQRYERLAKRDGGTAERRALAQQVCAMLKVHTQIEEELFYPAARAGGIDADMLDEAKVEHATAKDLIAQIESGNPDDDLYDARVTVLREYIQHHVVEEHTEMFPKCRRSAIDLVALRGELEARKASLEPAGATTAEPEQPKEEPGLLSRLSDKLFSSADDKGESGSGSRG